MKINREHTFIFISSIALILLMTIQLIWIIESAKIKETLFAERVNMALSKTAEDLAADKEICLSLEENLKSKDTALAYTNLQKSEIHKVDSMLKRNLSYYHLNLKYSFSIVEAKHQVSHDENLFGNLILDQQGCYNKNIPSFNERHKHAENNIQEMIKEQGLELKLNFPEQRQFILAEMGVLFFSSLILVLIVLFTFWKSTTSLIKEKNLSEQTAEFLNNMTHEFKTPLTNISLACKMILKHSKSALNEKTNNYLNIILLENKKLQMNVEQVLSMAALEKGEIPILKSAVDIHEIILDATQSMQIQIENKQGKLNLNLQAKHCIILGDKIHLINSLTNIIDNSIKYAKTKPEINITTYNQHKQIAVVISDKGIGMSPAHQRKIFSRYYRISQGNIHDTKGFGLGLTYVKKIIELLGGSIELESKLDKGTNIKIVLPYVEE
ncbi:MAG: HAMP domain-containing histidine kinase [Chitinophagaceae bacterium]|nr:HAMP domain-containing histidine kinase [Chitinophagaceae bacterium]